MSYSSDEMSDGAKLAVAGGLLAAGGFVAWLIGRPSAKTASGSGTLVSHANLGVAPTGAGVQPAYAAGEAVGRSSCIVALGRGPVGPWGSVQGQTAPIVPKNYTGQQANLWTQGFIDGWNFCASVSTIRVKNI